MIFNTERLLIRALEIIDEAPFFEMMGNPNVMNPIPLEALSRDESKANLLNLLSKKDPRIINIWALTLKEDGAFIGICGFLINNEDEGEIAYRLIERYWGFGYGTEIAKALIEYGLNKKGYKTITADVNIENLKSVKILEKFLLPVKEFYNKKDKCVDRRYAISKSAYYAGNE